MSTATGDLARRRLARACLVWSLACATTAAWWLADPGAAPLPADEPVSLLGGLGPRAGAALCLGFALAGAFVGAAVASAGRRGRAVSRGVLTVGVVTSVFFGVVAPDVQLLSFLGYATVLLGVPVVVVLLVAGAPRHRTNLVVLGVLGVAVVAGVAAGEVGGPTVELLGQIRDGFARVGPRPLVVAFLGAGGVLLGMLVLAPAPAGPFVARWGRVATVVAALGPVPYGLLRLTWATPWPQGLGPGGGEILEDGIRVFGLCLGLAALSGSWLTLGLISGWGRVWPRWLPGLRGRPVPVLAAVLPAGLVATALCAAAVSVVVMAVRDGSPGLVLLIPAPVWGPALLLATYAYYRDRAGPPPDRTGDPPDARPSRRPAHRVAGGS